MSKLQFFDFQAIKRQVTMLQILEHYGLMKVLHLNGDNITGTCPIERKDGNVAFRASVSSNCWNCFNQCGCNGDILDFVARKEKVSIPKAARLIAEWFDLSTEPAPSDETVTSASPPPLAAPAHYRPTTSSQLPQFAVKRYWEVWDEVFVEANTPEEAIQLAHDLPLRSELARFVPDSLQSDQESDVHPLSP